MSIQPDIPSLLSRRDQIKDRLYTSLHHLIFEAAAELVPPALSEADLKALVLPERGFPAPVVFAFHRGLMNAALTQNTHGFKSLSDDLARLSDAEATAPETLTAADMSEACFSATSMQALKTAFQDDVGLTAHLGAPDPAMRDAANTHLETAMSTLAKIAPDWHREIELLGSQIINTQSQDETVSIGGAAVFDAFGAVLINPETFRSPSVPLTQLVHEVSHQHMFLFHLDDAILLNDDEAAYASPLRQEPRPMEGIFHAGWVSARMSLVADAVLSSSDRPDWADAMAAEKETTIAVFKDCAEVIDEHAEFTPFGRALYTTAREAIDAL